MNYTNSTNEENTPKDFYSFLLKNKFLTSTKVFICAICVIRG